MALGILTTAIVSGFVFLIFVIAIQSLVIFYATRLMKYRDKTYKSALISAIIIGLTNYAISLAVLPFRQTVLVFEVLGISVYAAVLYAVIRWRYREKLKQVAVLVLIVLLLAIFLNLIAVTLISTFFQTLQFF